MPFCGADFELSSHPIAPAALKASFLKSVNEAAQTSSKIHDFAQSIKTRIENSHGLGWHIVVGADFSTELRYRKNACVLLSSKGSKMKVLIYRTIRTEKTRPQMEFEALIGPDMTNSDVKRQVVVNSSDIPSSDKNILLTKAKRLVEYYDKESDADTKICHALKHTMTYTFGQTWHVIVSKNYPLVVLPYHNKGTLADFSIDKKKKFHLVVYEHGGTQMDHHLDFMGMLNRLLLILAMICLVLFFYQDSQSTKELMDCDVAVSMDELNDDVSKYKCTQEQKNASTKFFFWRTFFLYGLIFFTASGSMLRIYRRTIKQKWKLQ